MVIDPQKLLPSSRINASSLVKVDETTSNDANFSAKENKIIEVKEKLIQIDDILKGTLAVEKKKIDAQKKKDQDEKRKGREEKLELKPEEKKEKKKKIKLSAPSFLQSIIDFFKKIIFGYLAIKLLKHLPKLMPIVMGIMKFGEWFIDFSGKILNGLVTFIDAGYKAYDATRGFIKDKLGDGAVEKFDEFSGLLNKVLNLALIVAMATSGNDLTRPGRRGGQGGRGGPQTGIQGAAGQVGRVSGTQTTTAAAARRYAARFGRDAAVRRFGADAVKSLGGKYGRSAITNFGRNALVKTLGGRGAAKTVKFAAGILKPIVKNVPLIGGIMEFILSWISGDPVGKAAFKGVGAGLGTWAGGALGTLIGGPIGTAVGMWVGSQGGSALGGLLYDAIFSRKEPVKESTPDIELKSEGGPVSSEKIKDTSTNDKELKANKIKNLQNQKEKIKVSDVKLHDSKSSFTKTAKTFNKIDFFGPILATTLKLITKSKDDKLTDYDYKNIGSGISNLIAQGIQKDKLPYDERIDLQKFAKWTGDTFKKSIEDKSVSIQESLEVVKNKEKNKNNNERGQENLKLDATDVLARFIAGMSPGSTDGPGSAATERDSATGVPTGPSSFSPASYKDDPAFEKEVNRIAKKFDIDASDLLGKIASESGFNPAADNGTHVGLIQFSKDSARAVGTTQAALKRMTRAQQMKYVEKYFDYWNLPKGSSAGHLYTVTYLPAFTSKPANYVLAKRGGFTDSWGHHPASWYSHNAGLDMNNDGSITIAELGERIQKKKREFGIQASTAMQTGGVVSRNMSRVETKTNSLMDYPSYGEETETNIIVINKKTVGSQNNHSSSKIRRRNITIKGSQSFSEVFDIYG